MEGGHTCPNCGAYVGPDDFHSCWPTATPPPPYSVHWYQEQEEARAQAKELVDAHTRIATLSREKQEALAEGRLLSIALVAISYAAASEDAYVLPSIHAQAERALIKDAPLIAAEAARVQALEAELQRYRDQDAAKQAGVGTFAHLEALAELLEAKDE